METNPSSWGNYLARGEPRPLVSVIMPTRGTKRELIARALASVAAQQQAEGAPFALEMIVVVDNPDGSTPLPAPPPASAAPGAAPIVRFAALRLAPPSGGRPGLARNAAIRAARGAWLAFLDDDDAWSPPKTARQLAAMAPRRGAPEMSCAVALEAPGLELPSAAALAAAAAAIGGGGGGGASAARVQPPLDVLAALPDALSGGAALAARNPIVASSVVVARAALTRAGAAPPPGDDDDGSARRDGSPRPAPFSERRYGQDWELWKRVLGGGGARCAVVKAPLVFVNAAATDLQRSTVHAEVRHSIGALVREGGARAAGAGPAAPDGGGDIAALIGRFSGVS